MLYIYRQIIKSELGGKVGLMDTRKKENFDFDVLQPVMYLCAVIIVIGV